MNKLEQIREYMNRNEIDGVLLISPENVRWLSGFSGDSAQILVTQNHQYFITDCRGQRFYMSRRVKCCRPLPRYRGL